MRLPRLTVRGGGRGGGVRGGAGRGKPGGGGGGPACGAGRPGLGWVGCPGAAAEALPSALPGKGALSALWCGRGGERSGGSLAAVKGPEDEARAGRKKKTEKRPAAWRPWRRGRVGPPPPPDGSGESPSVGLSQTVPRGRGPAPPLQAPLVPTGSPVWSVFP